MENKSTEKLGRGSRTVGHQHGDTIPIVLISPVIQGSNGPQHLAVPHHLHLLKTAELPLVDGQEGLHNLSPCDKILTTGGILAVGGEGGGDKPQVEEPLVQPPNDSAEHVGILPILGGENGGNVLLSKGDNRRVRSVRGHDKVSKSASNDMMRRTELDMEHQGVQGQGTADGRAGGLDQGGAGQPHNNQARLCHSTGVDPWVKSPLRTATPPPPQSLPLQGGPL